MTYFSCDVNDKIVYFLVLLLVFVFTLVGYTVDKLVLHWDAGEVTPVALSQQGSKELRQFRMVNLEYKNFTRIHNITGISLCFHLVPKQC